MAAIPIPPYLSVLREQYEDMFVEGNELQARADATLGQARALKKHYDGIIAVLEGTALSGKPATRTGRGKSSGAISNKWKGRLLRIALKRGSSSAFGGQELREDLGIIMSTAQVIRHFQPYLAAGYVAEAANGRYKLTEDGLYKIGLLQAEAGPTEP